MPKITSENEWNNLKLRFIANAILFCQKVESMDEKILDDDFVEKKYGSYLRNIEAVIEHSYYHLGQIVLIKKIILGSKN